MITKLVIGIPPRTKKNSQMIITNRATGRPLIIQSKQYREYEELAREYLLQAPRDIDLPVTVKALFYMPTRRRVDLTNLLEALDDILVKYHVLVDDNCSVLASHDGSRVLYDKEHPRTEVYISEY